MSAALQTWGQMMLKKYLPEMLVVLLITILSFALWTQTNRLNAAKNQTKAVQLAFDQYQVDQQSKSARIMADAMNSLINTFQFGKEKEDKDNAEKNDLQSQLNSVHVDIKRMQQQNDRLRSLLANNTATSAECKAAFESDRIYTDVYGECLTKYTQMAKNAQRSNTAGVICQRSYDSVFDAVRAKKTVRRR